MEQATTKAKQSGPLAEATARQEVVVQETRVAELEAQQLQVEVHKPTDAKACEMVTPAQADRAAKVHEAEAHARETELPAVADATHVRTAAEAKRAVGIATADATRARGLAQAETIKARGLAAADAIKARGEALAENQEAVIAQQLRRSGRKSSRPVPRRSGTSGTWCC